MPDPVTDEAQEFEPTKWWRSVDADGKLWCESSNENEVASTWMPGPGEDTQ